MADKVYENFITLTQYFDSEDDASNIEIQTNQEEILGFFSNEEGAWGWYSSPTQIRISIVLDGVEQEIDKNGLQASFLTDYAGTIELSSLLDFEKDTEGAEIKTAVLLDLSKLETLELEVETLKNVVQGIIKIVYLYNGKQNRKLLPYRLGISKDMAQLDLNASDITASIQSTKLRFHADGLEVYNGGLKIYDESYKENHDFKPAFYFSDKGNLYMRGEIHATTGTFKGEISADSGYFKGRLEASGGEIGGFILSGTTLESKYKIGEEEKRVPAIVLNGEKGEIYANNITLGANATVEEYIKLGNAYLYNPDNEKNKVLNNGERTLLESNNIRLNDDGTMSIGQIEIKGTEKESYIKCNDSWWIDGSGTAKFNDIYANNVHLQDAVLEVSSIQSVGSLMLFKDSWFVSKVSDNKITLDGVAPLNLAKGDYIYDGQSYYKITEEVAGDSLEVTLDKNWTSGKTVATKFGQPGVDFIFSLQGEGVPRENQKQFATGNSLTIAEFTENNEVLNYKKILVLGDLSQLEGRSGTGLYAENVELYGSLTTQVQQDNEITYAGINTKSTIGSDRFKENLLINGEEKEIKEPIIFFAGAPNKSEINKAAFYVTDKGSLYASKGTFEGAVITNGNIEGSVIKAAKVYGWEKGEAAALSIYDTNKGIAFKKENEETTLSINSDSFSIYDKEFININIDNDNNNHKVTFIGQGLTINDINIIDNQITSSSSDKICFNGKSITFNKESTNVEGCSFEVSNSRIIGKVSANFYQDLTLGKTGEKNLVYKPTSSGEGYDLYVQ